MKSVNDTDYSWDPAGAAAVDSRQGRRLEVEFPIVVSIKANPKAPTYMRLQGCCTSISQSGMLCIVDNFKEKYFIDLTTDFRFAIIRPSRPTPHLPQKLKARIAGLRFRQIDLPLCRIALAFENLSPEDQTQLAQLLKHLEDREVSR